MKGRGKRKGVERAHMVRVPHGARRNTSGIFEGEIKTAGPNVSRRARVFNFRFSTSFMIVTISRWSRFLHRHRGISRVASLDGNMVTSLGRYRDAGSEDKRNKTTRITNIFLLSLLPFSFRVRDAKVRGRGSVTFGDGVRNDNKGSVYVARFRSLGVSNRGRLIIS